MILFKLGLGYVIYGTISAIIKFRDATIINQLYQNSNVITLFKLYENTYVAEYITDKKTPNNSIVKRFFYCVKSSFFSFNMRVPEELIKNEKSWLKAWTEIYNYRSWNYLRSGNLIDNKNNVIMSRKEYAQIVGTTDKLWMKLN